MLLIFSPCRHYFIISSIIFTPFLLHAIIATDYADADAA
jgi:hypothetical protein